MTLKDKIDDAIENPARLERIYRRTVADGEEAAFGDAIAQCIEELEDAPLLLARAYRLNVRPVEDATNGIATGQGETRYWGIAIGGSLLLGFVYMMLAGSKPPVPIPGEAAPGFWIGWSPVTALGILGYLAAVDCEGRCKWYAGAAFTVALIGLWAAIVVWNRTDHMAILTTIHLPFAVWAVVGGSVALGRDCPAVQFHAFMVKSVETLLSVGIYLGAGGLLVGLSVGIFSVLGIQFSEGAIQSIAAYAMGAVPLLALASVCDLSAAPKDQNWDTGLARILHIVTRLMLPLSLGVLAIYVCWFIPMYFARAFEEREALIVYNATLIALIALLVSVVTEQTRDEQSERSRILYYALLTLGILSLLLNAYALAAILSRTLAFGLTVNRHAVLGWNMVTLYMLAVAMFRLWREGPLDWQRKFRIALARVMCLAVGWTIWVLFGVPHF